MIESIENGTDKISYQYDSLGNITKILENNIEVASYQYDTLNQLVKEDNKVLDRTITYTYDNGGNLLEKKYYSYKTENLLDTITYTYSTTWKDQLTSYDGEMITYDVIGNPITIGNSTLTWVNGRILQSYSNGTNNYQYKYNEDGIRIEKNINGKVTKYFLNGNDILFEDRDGQVLTYTYDESGVSGIIYQGNRYSFIKNIQGDIIGILNSNYQKLVDYEYDSWGKIVSVKDQNGNIITDSNHIGNINPFRYRGYYYDSETGFYYQNSRYYNHEWGRFINADGYVSTGQGIFGNNMFAYCLNNPVNMSDPTGKFAISATLGSITLWKIGVAIVGLAGTFILADTIAKNPPAFPSIALPKIESKSQSDSKAKDIAPVIPKDPPKKGTVIYRYGGTNPGNFVPSVKDVETNFGLPFSTLPPPPGKKASVTTIEALNATGVVRSYQDRPGHVRVDPVIGTLADWRAGGLEHPCTIAVKSVVIKWDGGI